MFYFKTVINLGDMSGRGDEKNKNEVAGCSREKMINDNGKRCVDDVNKKTKNTK